MAPEAEKTEVSSALSKLSLEPGEPYAPPSKAKAAAKEEVADSWEEEDLSDDPDEVPGGTSLRPSTPAAPTPIPVSPAFASEPMWHPAADSDPPPPRSLDPARRPEKTDAVARRMIAAGLGLKAPKQTEEQKAYQRSVREQERKRREDQKAEERRRQEQAEKAKAAVWDD